MYLNNFTDRKDVAENFQVELDEDIEILLAWYGYGSYDGESYILFTQRGQLYQVTASHCSCYGLEEQWEPVATSVEELEKNFPLNAADTYTEGEPTAAEELRKVIATLKMQMA